MSEHEKNIKEEKTDASQGMSRRAKRRIVSVASVCIVLIGVILLNVIASVLTGSRFTAICFAGSIASTDIMWSMMKTLSTASLVIHASRSVRSDSG